MAGLKKFENDGFFKVYGFVAAALLGFIVIVGIISPDLRDFIIEEDGPVEALSATAYFFCAAVMFAYLGKKAAAHWPILVVLTAMGMRELDFHSRFTAMGATKIKFYLSPGIPFFHKLFAVLCGLIILYCAVCLLVKYRRGFIASLKGLHPHAVSTATGLLFLLASLALDGLGGKMARIGFPLDYTWNRWAENAEEIFELGIPIMFSLGVRYYWAGKILPGLRRAGTSQRSVL